MLYQLSFLMMGQRIHWYFFFSTTASLDQRWLSEVEAVGTL